MLTTTRVSVSGLACAFVVMAFPAVAEDAVKGDVYTLGICPVSGEPLGSMGDPIVIGHEGREIRFCCAGCQPRFEAKPEKYLPDVNARMIEDQKPFYPLEKDIVTGEPLPEDPVNYIHKNRLFRFASKESLAKFEENPAPFCETLDQAVIEAQNASYPLETCVISGQELGSMGEPINYVVANRLVKFCCAGCDKTFEEMPAQHLAKIYGGEKGNAGGSSKKSEGSDHK